MKHTFKKILALGLISTMLMGALAGCGSKKEGNDTPSPKPTGTATTEPTKAPEQGETTGKPFEGVKLKYATTQTASTGEENQKLIELVKEQTGIEIEFFIVPNAVPGEVDKTLVSLMNGDEIDIIYNTKPGLKTFYNAGVLSDMNELAVKDGYDMKSVYGEYLPEFDGGIYGLPAFSDIWITLYNKKIFDDAGVPYPTAENWTWEKYVETAKLLNNADKDIFGSLMLDYDSYNYMYALQKGWQPYKADGTANFDDPLFKESLEFYYGLGNTEKIQPSILDFKASGTAWNAFFTTGQYGMFVCGGWTTSLLNNFEKYPRDWKVGILPLPYPEGEEASTLTVPGCYAIPTSSKNKEAAFAAIQVIAENQYTLGTGRVPARINLSDAQINDYIENSLATPFTFDELTVEEFKTAWFESSRKALSEKIIGPGDAAISQVIIAEAQLYGQGGQDIDTTIKNIQGMSNAAISSDK